MFDPLKVKTRVILHTSAAFAVGLGAAYGLGWAGPNQTMPTLVTEPQVDPVVVAPALDLSSAFVATSEAVTPAVVRVETKRNRPVQRLSSPWGQDEIPEQFRRFFNPPSNQEREEQFFPRPQEISGGSGFIVSREGYILTNNHVVDGANGITVHLQDGRRFPADLVGTDPFTDVAVIKIEGEGLPALSIGSAEDVRVGEWVLAIGNPGFRGPADQLDYTVTAGIVSAKNRSLNLLRRGLRSQDGEDRSGFAIESFIQTDAVINPGNSGGPMVNLRGQVVGINTAIASATGYYQGYGFAVPIDLAEKAMTDLIKYGRVMRPYLGVGMNSITPEDAEVYRLPSVGGALVQSVADDGPAEKAGLRQEDVIVAMDGKAITASNELSQEIFEKRPGDEVTIRVYREGEPLDVKVRLGSAPIHEEGAASPRRTAQADEKLGIRVEDLTSSMAQRLGYEATEGVVVSDVQMGGAASRRGIRPGDLILMINRQEVSSAREVRKILDKAEAGGVVSFRLSDPKGQTRIVNLRVPL